MSKCVAELQLLLKDERKFTAFGKEVRNTAQLRALTGKSSPTQCQQRSLNAKEKTIVHIRCHPNAPKPLNLQRPFEQMLRL